MKTGATFSPCKKYRYTLWREWDSTLPVLNFSMLNPSTADEFKNDPTVERCERRARMWGYGKLYVTNIFAYRATDPNEMKAQDDPIGPDNDANIATVASLSDHVICAWGQHGKHMGRGEAVLKMLSDRGVTTYALKLSKDGTPSHPLYIAYDVEPSPWPNRDGEKWVRPGVFVKNDGPLFVQR